MTAPDHLSVRVEHSLRSSEEIVKKSWIASYNVIVIIIIIFTLARHLPLSVMQQILQAMLYTKKMSNMNTADNIQDILI